MVIIFAEDFFKVENLVNDNFEIAKNFESSDSFEESKSPIN